MRTLAVALFTIVLFAGVAEAACTGSSPSWNCTPDYTSLDNLLNRNSPAGLRAGDTIHISAGSADWPSTLTITKNISLMGSGIGNTIIRNTGTNPIQTDTEELNRLIIYSPTNTTNLFRISGFSFDLNNRKGVLLNNNSLLPPITQLRIDHNHFFNSNCLCRSAIFVHGVRGVIDNNVFDDLVYPATFGYGNDSFPVGVWDWANFPELVWGSLNDNIYVEDNVFTNVSTAITNGDEGGRYVLRYNSFGGTGVGHYPWLDMHGGGARGQPFPPGIKGTMGGEVYGNTFSDPGYLISHRGGRLAFHHNQAVSGSVYHPYDNDGCPAEDKEKINNSYIYLNRIGTAGTLVLDSPDVDNCGGVVVKNSTYWMDAPSLSGTVGVGAGSLANRPATCTIGVGYWATTQPTTNLTGMVGPNPSLPISGTLYKCTNTNTWTAWYTPLVYPHPLRTSSQDSPPGPPGPPQNLRVN